ncbi:CAP domain-containing protein [Bacillus songklensis]|uniref:CAP domain-containing protein n=1 Tax=Bacillus songklensis TaxID=1069116 RepID=A0ABV8B7N9_9BACI
MKNKKLRFATIIGAMSFGLLATQTQADASTVNCPVNSKQNIQHINVQDINDVDELLKKFNIQIPTAQAKQTAPKAAPAPQTNNEAQAQPTEQAAPQPTPKAAPASQTSNETQAQPAAEQTANQSSVSEFEKKVVELVNQERQKQGLKPLQLDTKLSDVAREKSKDMMNKNYFDHTSPTYGSPFDMMKKFGIQYSAAGENIAKGQQTPEEVMNSWMNSDGHRRNILDPNFTHIGVGYVEGSGSTYWTQMFIGK